MLRNNQFSRHKYSNRSIITALTNVDNEWPHQNETRPETAGWADPDDTFAVTMARVPRLVPRIVSERNSYR